MLPYGDFKEFLSHLTDNARSSLAHAEAIARRLGSAYIGTEHLLLGVLAQETSVASKILAITGVTLDRAQLALNLTPKTLAVGGAEVSSAKALSETAKLTLRLSMDVAQEFNQDFCGTEHILYSILSQKNARATILLRDMNIDVDDLLGELEQFLNRQQYEYEANEALVTERKQRKKQLVDFFSTDLTDLAKQGRLDPVVGRDHQIARMVTILGRRTKNNPVLIGEPGVGKSAIVEGLAQRIAAEEVPDNLLDKRILMLDLAGMIAGTKYRGEFEERLRRIIDELSNDDQTIVFIDEIHLLVGAGAAEGAIDAANMLKPALARGKLQLIGATTLDEYKKHIEKDAALERRFQTVQVPEPSVQETVAILRGLKRKYEEHHGIRISDEVLAEAAQMAKRYISDRFMPDKAIDLVDESASYARIDRGKATPELRKLKRELKAVTARMEDAVEEQNYQRAAQHKMRMSQINQQLEELSKKKPKGLVLSVDDIAHTVARMTGIPAQRLQKSEAATLLGLEQKLAKHVIGQDEAVGAIAAAVRRNRAGIGQQSRPIGSFIFMGPTGVGKTELARVLAREFFGDSKALIKIDMSEFSERHNAARLLGAPAGYVGYEEGGQLTEKVRRQPYSVILFDEIEKAHPEILNMLLQILEDGQVTDAKGRVVSFKNCIVILTSNIGAEKLQKEAALGFRAVTRPDEESLQQTHRHNAEMAKEELRRIMRPELLNRFDKVIVFNAITRTLAQSILDLQLKELAERLAQKGLGIKVLPAAKKGLLDKGYDAKQGVRPLRRTIERHVEDRIAHGILSAEYGKGDIIKVSNRKGDFVFEVAKE